MDWECVCVFTMRLKCNKYNKGHKQKAIFDKT